MRIVKPSPRVDSQGNLFAILHINAEFNSVASLGEHPLDFMFILPATQEPTTVSNQIVCLRWWPSLASLQAKSLISKSHHQNPSRYLLGFPGVETYTEFPKRQGRAVIPNTRVGSC